MIIFEKKNGEFTFEFSLIPKCFGPWNHTYGPWGEPYKVYAGHWYQSRKCTLCHRVTYRDIGFIQAPSLELP